jgi:hypothetical protein
MKMTLMMTLLISSFATLGAGAVFLVGGAAALQATLLTAGALTLGAGGIVGAGLETTKSIQNYQENSSFEQAIYSNLSDQETLEEAQESLQDFYSARNSAIIEFGTSLIPIGSLKVLSRLGHLKHASGSIKIILESAKLRSLFREVGTKYGPEKLQELFMKIISLGPKAAEQLAKMKNWSLGDIVRFMKWGITWIPKQQIRFWKSVSNPLRFFIKPRTQNATKLDIFLDPMGHASGVVLRSHQFRAHIPVLTSMGGLMWASIAGENKIHGEIENASAFIPGFSYANEYANQGVLSSYERDELLRAHDLDIKNWSNNYNEILPAKIEEVVRLGYLTREEALGLSRLAHLAYTNAQDSFSTAKELNPSLTVSEHLETELLKVLEVNPLFLSKPANIKEMMFSFFDPLIMINGTSDLELIKISNEYIDRDLVDLSTEEDYITASIRFTSNSLSEGLPLQKALSMISESLDNPEALREKYVKAQGILPAEKGYLGLRADIPYANAPTRLVDPETEIEDELDVWEIFQNDPRFKHYADQWLSGEITDTEALDIAYEVIDSLNPLLVLPAQWKSRSPAGATKDEIDFLFGITDPSTANILLKPIGQVVLDRIYELSAPDRESDTDLSEWGDVLVACLSGAVNIWSEYYLAEAALISEEKTYETFHNEASAVQESQFQAFNEHLNTCVRSEE